LIIGGVDEAGRGPVIGPLVIAGYFIDSNQYHLITNVVKKDSKGYSSSRRLKLFNYLVGLKGVKILVTILQPSIIDGWLEDIGNLNDLEAYFICKIIANAKPNIVYVDSCDSKPEKFLQRISRFKRMFSNMKLDVDIRAELFADIKYPAVSAASIIAKVIRDSYISRLSEQYGEIGSGYPSDAKTKNFLIIWKQKSKIPPPFVRKQWKTVKAIFQD